MLNYVNFCQSIRLQGLSPCLNLDLQFAPQNMTVKRRFKIVLIFEIICGILESIIIKYPLPWHVQNVVCLFVLKKNCWKYENFCFINKNLYISGDIESTNNGRPHFGNTSKREIVWLFFQESYLCEVYK